MKFSDLALGARFKYLNSDQIWIKLSDHDTRDSFVGLIAEYHPVYITHPRWLGQRICSFCDNETEMHTLEVLFVG